MIVIIVFSSTIYLEWQKIDYEIEREKFVDSKFIINNVQSINSYEGGKYLKPALLSQSWPQLLTLDENKKTTHNIKRISLNNFNSIDQIMQEKENLGLTHLIVFDNNSQEFLNDIYYNESKYSFLTKIYDSSLNHKQPIKIFKID
jgi:hypothetical protein